MSRLNLHDEFLQSLHEKFPNKKLLVDRVSDILRIEKEPASRRLNGKVLFSVQEMGVLAKELGIVLDALLNKDKRYQWISFLLESPMKFKSIDDLYDILDNNFTRMLHVAAQKPVDFGCLFHELPLELYIYQPHLMKFMFFKWGHYFVGTDEFNDFSEWVLPERVIRLKEKIDLFHESIESTLYIWDESIMWRLAREIEYLHKMRVISTEDKENIKNDLRNMLTQLEKYLKGNMFPDRTYQNIDFYISHINVGTTGLYFSSQGKQLSFFQTSFSFSHGDECYETFLNIKEWVNSFKNISVLISGSGSLERRLFFKEQHKIIDLFLG